MLIHISFPLFYFFFQAEDGIRDIGVTGAQTCALPILDEVRRGVTDEAGKLTLAKVSAGRHTLRVRAKGFKEATVAVAPARRGAVDVKLVRTSDEEIGRASCRERV